LDIYLSSVKRHFGRTEGKDEIVADIESRIAEQLLESKENIITLSTVERVIAAMGKAEEFDDEENHARDRQQRAEHTASAPQGGVKKLYRNPDDAMLTGVSSGLAAYIGIDPIWVRLVFVLLTFAWGIGIPLYIVMWVLMPVAKTGGQRLEMAGKPVTLSTLSASVKERIDEVRNQSTLRKVITLPFRFAGAVLIVLGPVARILLGALLTVVSVMALILIMMIVGYIFLGSGGVIDDIPIETLLPNACQMTLFVFGGALAIAVPALFVLFGGISLLQKKSVISAPVGLGVLGVWLVAITVTGFGSARAADSYRNIIDESPDYRTVTVPIEITGEFDRVDIEDNLSVDIVESEVVSLTATGRRRDVEILSARVVGGVLVIERRPDDRDEFSFFWTSDLDTNRARLRLTVPAGLVSISARHGSQVIADDLSYVPSFSIEIDNNSLGDIAISTGMLTADVSSRSRLSLFGDAESAEIDLSNNAVLSGRNFIAAEAWVNARDRSRAEIGVTDRLNAEANNHSVIIYSGSPRIIEELANWSDVRPAGR